MGEFVKLVSSSTFDTTIDELLMWLPDEKSGGEWVALPLLNMRSAELLTGK